MSEEKPKVSCVLFYPSGKIAALSDGGVLIPQLQAKTIVELWADFATSQGYDLSGCQFKITSPLPPATSGAIAVDCAGETIIRWQ